MTSLGQRASVSSFSFRQSQALEPPVFISKYLETTSAWSKAGSMDEVKISRSTIHSNMYTQFYKTLGVRSLPNMSLVKTIQPTCHLVEYIPPHVCSSQKSTFLWTSIPSSKTSNLNLTGCTSHSPLIGIALAWNASTDRHDDMASTDVSATSLATPRKNRPGEQANQVASSVQPINW